MALLFKSLYRRSVLQPSDVPGQERREVLLSSKEGMRKKKTRGGKERSLEISLEDGKK